MFGYLKYFFGFSKYASDPAQQELALLIIEAVERRRRPNDVLGFLLSHGWTRADQGNRLAHAASLVRVMRADIYPSVKQLCHDIYMML